VFGTTITAIGIVDLLHEAPGALGIRSQADLLEASILVIGIGESAVSRMRAGEDRHLNSAVIVNPLNAPVAGNLAILENLGCASGH
jgi:hypothetical protein